MKQVQMPYTIGYPSLVRLLVGWYTTENLDELQESANDGNACIIAAKRNNTELSGHITVVVPESEVFKARRINSVVLNPVESQAVNMNREYVVKNNQWWMKNNFSSFGFWMRH
ncbi:hypothetical protein [Enterovibrio sp. 27052020O]|uniref:hypothetical protein n=1 Tax=Enterovibrio sp. 27052020O TaxID=3241166 RepID=UPI00388E44D1